MPSRSTSSQKPAHTDPKRKRVEHETIAEESVEDDTPLLAEAKSRGQVVFDPPYSSWRYPKKYKRY